MKPEQQRIAIAEACGWEKLYKGPEPDNRWMSPDRKYCTNKDIPDYLNDLNAMHEAEKVLTNQQRKIYGEKLLELLSYWNSEIKNHGHAVYELSHATAAQRAEAFLRTIGKWKETKGHLKLDPPTAGDVLDSNAY